LIYTAALSFHNDVKADLAAIKAASPDTHAKLLAMLRQLKADARMAEKLLDHGHGAQQSAQFSVSKWLREWKTGKDLWRLKFWDLESLGLRYRVIYLYLPQEARFVVMAIVEREHFDYDDKDHPIRKRITESLQRTYGIE
jgi:hypothetical protein